MIRVFLLLLSTIVTFWYVAYTLETKGPGYVWVSYNNYSVETTFWFFIGLLVVLSGFVFLTVQTVKFIILALKQFGLISRSWGVSKSEQCITQFRLAYADQHWQKADEAFKKGSKKSLLQPSDQIMAIRTSLHLNKLSEAKLRVNELKQKSEVNELSLRLLELDLAIAENNSGLGITLYSQLLKDYPKENNLKSKAFVYFIEHKSFEKSRASVCVDGTFAKEII